MMDGNPASAPSSEGSINTYPAGAISCPNLDIVSHPPDSKEFYPARAPADDLISPDSDPLLEDGWGAFSFRDLRDVMYGSEDLRGYFNYQKALNLRKLGVRWSEDNFPLMEPSEFLEAYHNAKMGHYEAQRMLFFAQREGRNGLTEEYIEKPLICRGMGSYQAKQGDLFEDLRDYMSSRNQPCVHLRLSMRAPRGFSPLDSLVSMKTILNRLMSFLQVRKGYRPHYLWVVEPTKRGHCHYHILFIGMNFLLPKEALDEWWNKADMGTSAGVWVENLRDTEEASKLVLGYLIKYILKPSKDKKWAGLLSLTRKREWGISQRLRGNIARWKADNELKAFACIGLTNSNILDGALSYEFIGILSKWEIATLLYSEPGGKGPPPELLLSDLREIRGISLHWNSTGQLPFSRPKSPFPKAKYLPIQLDSDPYLVDWEAIASQSWGAPYIHHSKGICSLWLGACLWGACNDR